MKQVTTPMTPLPATHAEALERIYDLLAVAHDDYLSAPDEAQAWREMLGAVLQARRLALAALGRLRPRPGEGG